MSDCQYFREKIRRLETKEISPHRLEGPEIRLPWCAHPASPVPVERAGGDRERDILSCEGLKSKCAIPVARGGYRTN